LHVFENKKDFIILFDYFEQLNEVRMGECHQSFDFGLIDGVFPRVHFAFHLFDGHHLSSLDVLSLEDLPEGTVSEGLANFVLFHSVI
jgi:hypothetical protein